MLRTIRSFIPELLGVIVGGSPLRIKHRWIEFKEDMAEYWKQKALRKAREPVMPEITGCSSKSSISGRHDWHHKYDGWISGIHDGEAIGRGGWRCYNCRDTNWTETDEEFVKLQPDWVLIGAEHMPEKFLEYFTMKQLQERVNHKHNKKAQALINEQIHCRERLIELDELSQQGKLTLTTAT